MSLLPEEQQAKAFVARIGDTRAQRILTSICKRIDRRIEKGNRHTFSNLFDRYSVRRTALEVSLMHKIKLGISLNDTYFTPVAARQRIIARIAKRNALRQSKALNMCQQISITFE